MLHDSSLKHLLDCMMNEKRSSELINTFSEIFGTLPAALETIGVHSSPPAMPENVRMLLSMIPPLHQTCLQEQMGPHPLLDTLRQAGEYAHSLYVNAPYECVRLICLDENYRLKECFISSEGGLKNVSFYPRKLLQAAFLCGAHAVILCHNHPSDWAFFSEADINATRELLVLFAKIRMPLLDHILIAGSRITSMRSRAYIPEPYWMNCGPNMLSLPRWRAGLPHSHKNISTTQL